MYYLIYIITGIVGFAIKVAVAAAILVIIHEVVKKVVEKQKCVEVLSKIIIPEKAAAGVEIFYSFSALESIKNAVGSINKEGVNGGQQRPTDFQTVDASGNGSIHMEMSYPVRCESYFDGGLLSYIGNAILAALLTFFTLGLGLPWACCIMFSWEARHTIIEGRRLKFIGTGGGLFLNWILWVLLTIITFGIFSFWLKINLKKWQIKNTVFDI